MTFSSIINFFDVVLIFCVGNPTSLHLDEQLQVFSLPKISGTRL